MSPHPTNDEEQQHPLAFLYQNPIVSILGDPLGFDLQPQLQALGDVRRTNPLLASFLSDCCDKVNSISKASESDVHLSLDAFASPSQADAAKQISPELRASLEVIVALGSYIAACYGVDSNSVGAGAENTIHDRIRKYGQDGFLDLTRFGLVKQVLHKSSTVADVCNYGVNAAALALSLSLMLRNKQLEKRLFLPRAVAQFAAQIQGLSTVGKLFEMAVVHQGTASVVQEAQTLLVLEHGVMGFVSSHDYLTRDEVSKMTNLDMLSPSINHIDLSFLEARDESHLSLLKALVSGNRTESKTLEQVLTRAMDPQSGHRIAVFSFGAGVHLSQSCCACLSAGSTDVSFTFEMVDVLSQVQRGNFKLIDRNRPVTLSAVKGTPTESIAVVGMSCRLPGAESTDELWQELMDGRDQCRKIPERLFHVEDYQSKSYKDKNTMRASSGNFIERAGYFDPHAFGIDPELATKLDPQIRLALLVALETVEKAGYSPTSGNNQDKQPIGSIFGLCSDDYQQNRAYTIEPPFTSALLRANIPTKVNQFFGWGGPAVTLDTACSGSLVAIESACNYLLQGKCNAVLTGGINVLTQPQIFIGLDRGFFLSPTGQCKTLDDKGDGYSRADAVSFVMLKRMSDAVKDGNKILAVVNSAATNHSGESFSITHPHYQTQRRLYRSGLIAAGLSSPNRVNYAELHGTGTAAGDFEEMTGIVTTYAKTRPEGAPLVIGSAKANLGHSESTSGATSLVKTLLVFEKGLVPPHIGVRTQLNTKLPDLTGVHIPFKATEVKPADVSKDERVFTVSNFSAAAGNTLLVLGRASSSLPVEVKSCSTPAVFVLSGATMRSLRDNCDRLTEFVGKHPEVNVSDLCFTLLTKRLHHAHRITGLVSSVDDIHELIRKHQVKTVIRKKKPQVAFAFSGQGSQYLDMGKELFQSNAIFKALLSRCNEMSKALGFGDLLSSVVLTTDVATAPEPTPIQFQLALVSIEISLAALFTAWGINVVACAGHSLGEYSALHVAGVLSLRDLLYLVGSRARLMLEKCEAGASTMLAIKADEEKVLKMVAESKADGVEIACYNSQDDLVLAGPLDSIQAIKAFADSQVPKVKSMVLSVPYAFHSNAVQPLVEHYLPVAESVRFKAPRIPVAANNGSLVTSEGTFSGSYLVKHLRNPVRFFESIHGLTKAQSIDCFIEIGPHSTCLPMLRSIFNGQVLEPALVPTLKKGTSAWTSIQTTLLHLLDLGISVDWSRLMPSTVGVSHALPTYAFDLESYWVPFRDRGLRDHLVEEEASAEPVAQPVGPSKHPAPRFSLLTSCTKLDMENQIAQFEALINKKPFIDMVLGHLIVGHPLTPATVFAELALEAAAYVVETISNSAAGVSSLEVSNLAMFSSLFPDTTQPSQAVLIDVAGSPFNASGATVQFFSKDLNTGVSHQHGSCFVTVTDVAAAEKEWKRIERLVKDRIGQRTDNPSTVLRQKMIYLRFENIVAYSEGYQGMREVFMDGDSLEAVSHVTLQASAPTGQFVCSPMLLDSLGQLTGFISNVGVAQHGQVYIADAIGRIVAMPGLSRIVPGKGNLTAWARMHPADGLCCGDVYFLGPENEFLGCMQDVVFKQLKKSALERLVSMGAAQAAARADNTASKKKKAETKMSDSAVFLPSPPALDNVPPMADHLRLAGPSGCSASPIFLLPDGTGSAGCFTQCLGQDWKVPLIGLSSPFVRPDQLEQWNGGISQLSAAYFQKIIQLQPEGPYVIGGYSLGAVCAVELCRLLTATGRDVDTLILMECPALQNDRLEPLPSGSLDAIIGKIEGDVFRKHFQHAARSVPGHKFAFDWPEPSKVIVVNAADQSVTPNLMTSKPSDWKSVFKLADLRIEVADGDHQTFIKGALDIVSRIIV